MKCTRCGALSTAADDLCAQCRFRRLMLEAREQRDSETPADYRMRQANDA